MDYTKQNAFGRAHAVHAIQDYQQTGNAPRFVQTIREAATDETGFGVGFMFELAERVAA